MKMYQSFDDIELELQQLDLQRQITFEKMKALKQDLRDDLQPYHWLQTGLKYGKKFGTLFLIKKLFRK